MNDYFDDYFILKIRLNDNLSQKNAAKLNGKLK